MYRHGKRPTGKEVSIRRAGKTWTITRINIKAGCKSNYVELEFFKELSTLLEDLTLLLYCESLYNFYKIDI